MLFIQIANIFNDLAAADPDLQFFHWGLPADVNKNIANNYDPQSQVGRQFPYLLQVYEPIENYAVQEPSDRTGYETHVITLHFIDTCNYTAQAFDFKRDTRLKVISKLQLIARRFLAALKEYTEEYALPAMNILDARFDPQPQSFTAGTAHLIVSFRLEVPVLCSEVPYDLTILETDPTETATYDKEDVLDNQSL